MKHSLSLRVCNGSPHRAPDFLYIDKAGQRIADWLARNAPEYPNDSYPPEMVIHVSLEFTRVES